MLPYDATKNVFVQQFGNRVVYSPSGKSEPVRMYLNLDENGKHPITGEDVVETFISPGTAIIGGPCDPETIIEASGVKYGFSVGLGGYVVLTDKGEFPGITPRSERSPGELPELKDVLKVATNWYQQTPYAKQGISIEIIKDAAMSPLDTHIVLSRALEQYCSVALFVRYPYPTDGIPHLPELLLARFNTNSVNDQYTPFIEAAFDIISNSVDTDAGYNLMGLYRELRITKTDTGRSFDLVRLVVVTHSEKPHRGRFEHVTNLAKWSREKGFVFNPALASDGMSTYGLTNQLESLISE